MVASSGRMRRVLPGGYEIIAEIGKGGMGSVYLARASGAAGFRRLVAVKTMHAHLLGDERAVGRFVNEARLASRVHHANVVDIQQVVRGDNEYFLVLDYVEGDSLYWLLRRSHDVGARLAVSVVTRIALDALAGLHAVHEAKDERGEALEMLHRDICPQNLLVGSDGVTRLTDFGVAKGKRPPVTTGAMHLMGRVRFMPPEYLQQQPVDRRLDVYAMGVTLWTAMAGTDPWEKRTDAGAAAMAMLHGVPSLSGAAPHVPPAVAAVVMRACAGAKTAFLDMGAPGLVRRGTSLRVGIGRSRARQLDRPGARSCRGDPTNSATAIRLSAFRP